MSNVSSGEKESPLHMQSRLRFKVLRQHLAQNYLLGEILASDHERLLSPGSTACEAEGDKHIAESNRGKKPRAERTRRLKRTPHTGRKSFSVLVGEIALHKSKNKIHQQRQ